MKGIDAIKKPMQTPEAPRQPLLKTRKLSWPNSFFWPIVGSLILLVLVLWYLGLKHNWQRYAGETAEVKAEPNTDTVLLKSRFDQLIEQTTDVFSQLEITTTASPTPESVTSHELIEEMAQELKDLQTVSTTTPEE